MAVNLMENNGCSAKVKFFVGAEPKDAAAYISRGLDGEYGKVIEVIRVLRAAGGEQEVGVQRGGDGSCDRGMRHATACSSSRSMWIGNCNDCGGGLTW